jgi:hypothetical protein
MQMMNSPVKLHDVLAQSPRAAQLSPEGHISPPEDHLFLRRDGVRPELIELQPIIEAGRFNLRPIRNSDAGLIALYTSDRRLAEGTRAIPHPLPPGAAEAYVQRSTQDKRDEDVWVLDGSAHGQAEVLGIVGLQRMDRDQSEITFWVAPCHEIPRPLPKSISARAAARAAVSASGARSSSNSAARMAAMAAMAGSVWAEAVEGLNTLIDFRYQQHFFANRASPAWAGR